MVQESGGKDGDIYFRIFLANGNALTRKAPTGTKMSSVMSLVALTNIDTGEIECIEVENPLPHAPIDCY